VTESINGDYEAAARCVMTGASLSAFVHLALSSCAAFQHAASCVLQRTAGLMCWALLMYPAGRVWLRHLQRRAQPQRHRHQHRAERCLHWRTCRQAAPTPAHPRTPAELRWSPCPACRNFIKGGAQDVLPFLQAWQRRQAPGSSACRAMGPSPSTAQVSMHGCANAVCAWTLLAHSW
jgi:hypothetical protein